MRPVKFLARLKIVHTVKFRIYRAVAQSLRHYAVYTEFYGKLWSVKDNP
jgi:hypothetical protein